MGLGQGDEEYPMSSCLSEIIFDYVVISIIILLSNLGTVTLLICWINNYYHFVVSSMNKDPAMFLVTLDDSWLSRARCKWIE